jgi:shikimate kinase
MADAGPDHRHLVLVGLMGAGKTTVGVRCARILDRPFVDTDQLVEANTAMSVAEIFQHQGEARFRDLERAAVADACASPAPLVIACGGGAVLDPENRRRLRDTGVVVWLRASPTALGTRVGTGADRPLLQGGAPAVARLEHLTELRAPAYEAVAHASVDTESLTVEEVAARVIEEWRAWSG